MSNCKLCNSKHLIIKKYDRHVLDLSLKGIVKTILPYIHPIIPRVTTQLKQNATKHLNGFKGNIKVCNTCGYGVMDKIPNNKDLHRYYKNQYWAYRSVITPPVFKEQYKNNTRAIAQVDFILDELNQADNDIIDVLEIGAADSGAILLLRDYWKKNSLSLNVCEPGEQWSNYYQQCGIERVANYYPFQAKTNFDYIHTSHWLEHVGDLDKTMTSINGMLNKKGFIFVEVPNTTDPYWDLPINDTPHIHFFTKISLEKLFLKYGFECLRIGEYGITNGELRRGYEHHQNDNEKGVYLKALFRKN